MSIMSNVLNKRTMINTTRNKMAADFGYKRQKRVKDDSQTPNVLYRELEGTSLSSTKYGSNNY